MINQPQTNIESPTGKYTIMFGEVEENSMGGAYAADIYLKENYKPPFLISIRCYGDVRWTADDSSFFFLYLNGDRKIQVMQYIIESRTLKLFYDIFEMAEFENVNNHGYSVNGRNWIEHQNRYNEGLVICDTNMENVEKLIVINDSDEHGKNI
jgi:hypothetical protein